MADKNGKRNRRKGDSLKVPVVRRDGYTRQPHDHRGIEQPMTGNDLRQCDYCHQLSTVVVTMTEAGRRVTWYLCGACHAEYLSGGA